MAAITFVTWSKDELNRVFVSERQEQLKRQTAFSHGTLAMDQSRRRAVVRAPPPLRASSLNQGSFPQPMARCACPALCAAREQIASPLFFLFPIDQTPYNSLSVCL